MILFCSESLLVMWQSKQSKKQKDVFLSGPHSFWRDTELVSDMLPHEIFAIQLSVSGDTTWKEIERPSSLNVSFLDRSHFRCPLAHHKTRMVSTVRELKLLESCGRYCHRTMQEQAMIHCMKGALKHLQRPRAPQRNELVYVSPITLKQHKG